MKNFLTSIIIIITASALLQQFLPWWIMAIPAFIVCFFVEQKSFAAFGAGFVAVFCVWFGYSFFLSAANNNILAIKVAELLPLKGRVWLLLTVTGLVGGLVSGFAALSGNLTAKLRQH